jgi:hypothetical protein
MKMLKMMIATLAFGIMVTVNVAAQTPQMMPQQQSSSLEVTDEELKAFIEVVNTVQGINQASQAEMVSAVEENGMTVERFSSIAQSQQNPESNLEVGSEEMKLYEETLALVEKIQIEARSEMEAAINESPLTMERYQEIAMAAQSDMELQKRLQALMQG